MQFSLRPEQSDHDIPNQPAEIAHSDNCRLIRMRLVSRAKPASGTASPFGNTSGSLKSQSFPFQRSTSAEALPEPRATVVRPAQRGVPGGVG